MILYGELTKLEPQADGSIKVHGVASTAARDTAGEIVTAVAMKAALPAYLAFGAIREMHQPRAAGSALHAAVDEDGLTRVVAHVVDPVAVRKVQAGVYKGLSIGGKVLARDPADPTIITGIRLDEISLVDRPCNPEAVIDLWKAQRPPANAAVKAEAERLAIAAGRPGRRNDYLAKARESLIGGASFETAAPQPPQDDEGSGAHNLRHAEEQPARAASRSTQAVAAAHEQTANYNDQTAHGGFADGLQAKYPLDTPERIRAAWAAVASPQALAQYGEAEVAAMRARISLAWRDRIDPAGPPAAAVPAEKRGDADDLRKLADAEDALAKAQGEVALLTSRLDGQAAEIERLKREPLPPRAASSHLAKAVSKQEDDGGGPASLSPDDFARALDAMRPDERAHLLMKAALSRPIAL